MTNFPVAGVSGRYGYATHKYNAEAVLRTTKPGLLGDNVMFDYDATNSATSSTNPDPTSAGSPFSVVREVLNAGDVTLGWAGILMGDATVNDIVRVAYAGDILANCAGSVSAGDPLELDAYVTNDAQPMVVATPGNRIFAYAITDAPTGGGLTWVRFQSWGFGPAP